MPDVARERLSKLFKDRQIVRFVDLKDIGLGSREIDRLVSREVLEKVGHGAYRLSDAEAPSTWLSFAVLAVRHPEAIICLDSAAAYYGFTTANPINVHAAFPYNSSIPSSRSPSVQGVRWQEKSMTLGIETVTVANTPVKITSKARTVVDLLRAAERSGDKELALEVLKSYVNEGEPIRDLSRYAKALNREKSIRPYLDAVQAFRM
ncbi:type IV toxin-antitoxin system AbiEi family antitoxin domain-containing protein [Thalassospira xianhensis]|uniref:Transcriptional regulator, AbiEi antitoxin, Type IV TA system n=2 Tax=Thalassospira TaxID=168934 RepID=A0A285TS95_9PROT|nr:MULTISPECIES: type IV toxin-antitoxin system AbiEi family antitoxin domain-containing protein [Thalassospira]RCK07701.1 hypothetical protein TH5_01115 [Thalassospira xianhensis MCCC 1A02616]SOC26469.1 Transcriptional regulator, AbiEi antitoxin, Type IV TA system [Thalassospira xiamenensis]